MNRDFEDSVFLSHNSDDKSAVEEIKRSLESSAPPFRCWLDKDDLRSHGTWMTQIESIVAECKSAALFFGPSGRGPIHELERQKLVDRAARQRDSFWLVPVLLPGARKEDVDGFTSLFNWVDFSAGLDSPAELERLAQLLRGEAPGRISADDQITGEPYRGLERFDDQHAEFYFGRDEEIRLLCNAVEKLPFVAVIGASGSGKSSLVRAGLQTRLAQSMLPRLAQANTITVLPGSDPLRSLAEQLAAAVIPDTRRDERPSRADEYARRLQEQADGLRTLLGSLFARDDDFLLLIIDQFEEAFTNSREQQEGANTARQQTEQFVAQLSDLATHADGRFRLVITLRADFLARSLEFASLRALLQNERNPQLLLGELSQAALLEVIVLPAQHAGAYFEKGLVERISKDVEDQRGSLPLLEYALTQLWAKRRGRWLTNEGYSAIGRVAGALRQRADETLRSLTAEQREIAKNIFLRLTTLGEGVRDTRRRVHLDELYQGNMDQATLDEVLNRLSHRDHRLIVFNEDGTVQVTHEALIQEWDTLKNWLADNRQDVRFHRTLTEVANDWAKSCENPDEADEPILFTGARLSVALNWARRHPNVLNNREKDFLETSKRVELLQGVVTDIEDVLKNSECADQITKLTMEHLQREMDLDERLSDSRRKLRVARDDLLRLLDDARRRLADAETREVKLQSVVLKLKWSVWGLAMVALIIACLAFVAMR